VKFSLLVDSVIDSPYPIPLVPANVVAGDKTYLDKVELDTEKVVEMLQSGIKLTTAAMSPRRIIEAVKRMREPVLMLTVSRELSGIYRAAVVAARLSRKKLVVFDTPSVSIGSGLLACVAFEMQNEGRSVEEVLAELEKLREKVNVLVMLGTLKYIGMSGRVPELIGRVGDMMGLRPIISLRRGKVSLWKLVRNFEKGVELMAKKAKGRVLTAHIKAKNGVEKLEALLEEKGVTFQRVENVSAALAVHVGPGAVGVSFFE